MKKLTIFFFFLAAQVIVFACPTCERQKPKALQGITHGQGPDGSVDYIIMWGAILITVLTLFYTIKWLIKPGEQNKDHIKYDILN